MRQNIFVYFKKKCKSYTGKIQGIPNSALFYTVIFGKYIQYSAGCLLSKLRSSLSLFKVGLVERSRAYPSFRLKFLSVRPSWTEIKPSEIWRKVNQRRREPANLYQCQRSEQPVKQLWRHGQQQRSAIMKKQEETNL